MGHLHSTRVFDSGNYLPLRHLAAGIALFTCCLPADTQAQTTFHLHNEPSSTVYKQLKVAGPDVPAVTLQGPNLKGITSSQYGVASFDTAVTATPNGTIPSGNVVSARLWMRKTANWGTFKPRFMLFLNDTSEEPLCTGTSVDSVTTTFTRYDISCTTTNAITVYDPYFLWVGVSIVSGAGNHSVSVELGIEGTLDGDHDSSVVIPTPPAPPSPAPIVTAMSPVVGLSGTAVTLSGANFGATQASSTVKFNGVTAQPTNWSTTSITAPVPATASTGPVQVTTGAGSSNVLTFTVWTTGSIQGTVTAATGGAPLEGALVEALQSGIVKDSVGTGPNGSYAIANLTSGTYALRCSLGGFLTELRPSILVGGGAPPTVDIPMVRPGAITGQVNGGSVGLAGVSVSASDGADVVATTTTSGSGAYTFNGVRPGTYTVEAAAVGYSAQSATGIAVTENTTSTADFNLLPSSTAAIRYVYDALSRLAAVIDLGGETARYAYDAVGNVTSISRHSSATLSLIEFYPKSGPVGTTVTLSGTGFSTVPANNAVTFAGVAGSVSAASETSLVVTVPTGVPTGPVPVVVTVAGDSVQGPTTFEVTATLVASDLPGTSLMCNSQRGSDPLLPPTPLTILARSEPQETAAGTPPGTALAAFTRAAVVRLRKPWIPASRLHT